MHVRRVSMSLSPELLRRFDQVVRQAGFSDRSKALQVAMRSFLDELEWTRGDAKFGAGVIILVYDPEVHGLEEVLTEMQHRQHQLVTSTMHSHVDDHNCLETILLKGSTSKMRVLAERLTKHRGVKNLKLFFFGA